MELDDTDRLRHIRAAARLSLGEFEGDHFEAFAAHSLSVLGHVKNLEIIGEAACRMTKVGRAAVPGVPWPLVMKMRHLLVHDYFDIDVRLVFTTIRDDLPPLLEAVERALEAREAG